MKKLFFLLSLLAQVVHCSEPKKPISPQAQREAKSIAEASTQTSSATERWQIAKWKVLAGFRRAKLQHFMQPINVGLLNLGNEEEVFKRRIAQLELELAQRTKERDQLGNAFERAKEQKKVIVEQADTIRTHEHTIKLMQNQNRKLAAANKELTNKLISKTNELP